MFMRTHNGWCRLVKQRCIVAGWDLPDGKLSDGGRIELVPEGRHDRSHAINGRDELPLIP